MSMVIGCVLKVSLFLGSGSVMWQCIRLNCGIEFGKICANLALAAITAAHLHDQRFMDGSSLEEERVAALGRRGCFLLAASKAVDARDALVACEDHETFSIINKYWMFYWRRQALDSWTVWSARASGMPRCFDLEAMLDGEPHLLNMRMDVLMSLVPCSIPRVHVYLKKKNGSKQIEKNAGGKCKSCKSVNLLPGKADLPV